MLSSEQIRSAPGGAAARGDRRIARPRFWVTLSCLCAALIVSMTLAVGFGGVSIPFVTVWKIGLSNLLPDLLAADWSNGEARIVWEIRFPRIILAALVGAGLAVVGATLQAVTRNALADPFLFGASSGAAVGAVAVIAHVGAFVGVYTLPVAAFAGATAALLLVVMVARGPAGDGSNRLILAGVAVSFVLMAATNFMIFLGDQRAAHSVVFWMLGGLGSARWNQLWIPAVVVIAGLGVLLWHARALNAMMVGEETATTLGIEVAKTRLRLFVLSALITGVLVALSGAIGFVGLMVPHIVRYLVGADNRRVLPVCAFGGAMFLVWVDVVARTALSPQELPIGIITAALGGGFFVWLMRRRTANI